MSNLKSVLLPRRTFIQSAAALATSAFATTMIPAPLYAGTKEVRSIYLNNLHSDDTAKVDYWIDGAYIEDALIEVNLVMHDHHSGDVYPIDTNLIELLRDLQSKLEVARKPLRVYSGYRSPHTNHELGKTSKLVAKESFHMKGMAIDTRIDGVRSGHLFKAAKSLRRGGVGYYGNHRFVHIDTGPARTWGA